MESNVRNIGNFIQVDDKQVVNYNKDIIMTDLNENTKIVCRCYCTITANQSISYFMTVEDSTIFNSQKELIQVEIDKFKAEAIRIATEHNVPIL